MALDYRLLVFLTHLLRIIDPRSDFVRSGQYGTGWTGRFGPRMAYWATP